MNSRLLTFCGIAAVALAAALSTQLHGQQSGSNVRVTLNYTGSGTVDSGHKIYVALWDGPGFVQGSGTPVAVESTSSKTGTVTFSNVKVNPAYVSAAFDPSGKWDAQSAPPPGSSLGMYGEGGKPAPIDTHSGQTAAATINFDDSVKVH